MFALECRYDQDEVGVLRLMLIRVVTITITGNRKAQRTTRSPALQLI